MSKTKQFIAVGIGLLILLGGAYYGFMSKPELTETTPIRFPILNKDKKPVGEYILPSEVDIVKEPNAEEIMYGRRLMVETKRLLPDFVGASMNCNSCHIAQGRADAGAPFINTFNSYPRHMPRPGAEISLAGRINGCFQRSMNGKALPLESKEMNAMLAYIKWLGQNVPKDQKVDVANAGAIDMKLIPNPEHGKSLYAQHCASCHGVEGEGLKDSRGDIVFPPLWGDESFNIGAGLARTFKAAQFIKYSMPMGVNTHNMWGQGGILSDQDAVDLAEYFTHQPRPDFAKKHLDWPNGDKPKDARY